ncbi:leucine-rich repeat-containing protein 15 [Eupeodes corollae]|uniref:leucine-rich repeat-containing protein 15 n=1 Tax=Eupeodes corollae TaxID=290404 RepID=UPI00248F7A07|nr:leucine-rich repeat-containing protein 15 [Eupeodes corollae]
MKSAIVIIIVASVYSVNGGQLKRVWMKDHCSSGLCQGITISRDDYVILSNTPITKQIILTFVNSTIAKIPHLMFDTFPDLQILRMENCSVETFEKPQFEGASNLMGLFLANNLIRDIPKNIFLGADNLNTLSLAGNQLRQLQNHSFNALKELKSLDLSHNKLENLPLSVFSPMRKLMELNLSNNKLTTLPERIFEKTPNLTKVHLSYNKFLTFESEYFKNHPKLSLLDISGNPLVETTINFDILDTLLANDCELHKLTIYGFVKEVELRNNSLQDIPNFPNAANVTVLDLSVNPIASLEATSLRRLIGLTKLNFSRTKIHDFPEGIFKKQTKLKVLDISNNSLYNLKVSVFDNLKALQYFYFHQNNWNCDFLQLLMSSFVKRREIVFAEDDLEPDKVDDYVDGVACWYESNKSSKKCSEDGESVLELAIIRNDIKAFVETVDKKFVKIFRLLDEIKSRV